MDVVYSVKPSNMNLELRLSLRSLANLPHDNVAMVGYTPGWVHNVISIDRHQSNHTKYANTTNNLLAACISPDVSEDFIYMNDDFYIMSPVSEIPVFHRGLMDEVISYYGTRGSGACLRGMIETKALLNQLGFPEPISYELHVPMVINKKKFLETMALQREFAPDIAVVHKRSLYGNCMRLGGQRLLDPKIHFPQHNNLEFIENKTFLSTSDTSIQGFVGGYLVRTFDKPCQYER
jgi:hypothetical protein